LENLIQQYVVDTVDDAATCYININIPKRNYLFLIQTQ